jgi:predicted ATPase/class 3 adenylate cyclase
MSSLPSGTVTFLFTDIEGSTKLAQEYPDNWEALRGRHHAKLKSAFEECNGYVFQIIGDAFCVAFHTAGDAVRAAAKAQMNLGREDWGSAVIKVRIGIQTGEAELQENGEYHGYLTLSRVQRMMSAAHGGQVLISLATEELVREELPEGVTLRDMGERRLKDLIFPEHIFQLVIPGLPDEFPPLKTLDAYRHNLPAQMTSFIGREKDIAEVRSALVEHRLVTLTGSGGTGKTRLSLQVAAEMLEQFQEGVWFVELSPLTDPGLVPQTVLATLGISEQEGKEIAQTLVDSLRDRKLLLIFDNCEHLIQASAVLADTLLTNLPGLTILATSREALGVEGELAWHVPSLSLPDVKKLPAIEQLPQYEAIRLFIERAALAQPRFNVTEDNASAIAQICFHLDGIPLAIELAAARVKVLSVEQIAKRLDDRFRLLTGSSRTALAHQQTLRATIDWSYNLLSEQEQRLFRRLAVFIGGWVLESAEAVCSLEGSGSRGEIEPEQILDLLSQLVNKSLVLVEQVEAESRYHRLETIREYAREKLLESGEKELLSLRHLRYFVRLAEEAEPELSGGAQTYWMDRLQLEHANIRAALDWSYQSTANSELGLRLSGALADFWVTRGFFHEGRERLIRSLSQVEKSEHANLRGKVLIGIADITYRQSDYPATKDYAGQALTVFRKLGDKHGIAIALDRLGNVATEEGDYDNAPKMFEEALTLKRELNNRHGIASSLINLGWVALRPGNYALASSRLEEALDLHRQLGDKNGIAMALSGLSEVAVREGDLEKASQLIEASLAIRKEIGYKWGIGVSYGTWAWIAMRQRNWQAASDRLLESISIRKEIGDKGGMAWCLERLAEIALENHADERSVKIFSAASALRASIGSVIDPADQPVYEQNIANLRSHLGEKNFSDAWEDGFGMTLEDAISYATEESYG